MSPECKFSGLSCSSGLLRGFAAFDDAHDVGFLHDQEFLAIDLHFGAGPFAEQDEIAGLHFRRHALAVVVQRARTDRDDFAFLRLLLCGLRNNDAAGGLLLFLHTANDNAIAKRTESHEMISSKWLKFRRLGFGGAPES